MAVNFKIPKSPSKSVFQMNTFEGCDFTNAPANVDEHKSPNCVNMIRDVPGKIRKTMGFKTVMQYSGERINGLHYYKDADEVLVHAGTKLYFENYLIFEGMNDAKSKSWQFNNKLYIQDGKNLIYYECGRQGGGSSAYTKQGYTYASCSGTYTSHTINMSDNQVVTLKMPYSIEWVDIVITGESKYIEIPRVKFDRGETYHYVFKNTYGNSTVIFSARMYGPEGITSRSAYTFGAEGLEGSEDCFGNIRMVDYVSQGAYVPTVTIAKAPNGGGVSYEPINMLQPMFYESFKGTATDKVYHLSFDKLDPVTKGRVIAQVLQNDGSYQYVTEGSGLSVDRERGIVTFINAPGVSPVTGEDNVKIQAYKTFPGYADRIYKCTISTLYGVNGNPDRLFVSGNPDYINYDWFSQFNDSSYFPDTNYSVLGTSGSAIVGYSIVGDSLATHKDDKEENTNILIRKCVLDSDGNAVVQVVNNLQGAGAICPWNFNYLGTEPMFLTKKGVYTITSQDIVGEKYSQNRSFYLDGKLLDGIYNLDNTHACVYNDFYVLAVDERDLFILDGQQTVQPDKSMPYSTRAYAGFFRKDVPARVICVLGDTLYFGTSYGAVCKFNKDKIALDSYNDDGRAIECIWETPDLDGMYFFKNKTFRYLAVNMSAAISTSIKIYAMKRGLWNLIKTDNTTGRYFYFPSITFSKFSFSSDKTKKTLGTKIRLKKVDKARFRIENTEVNEPFGISDIALEYIESGHYKG